jgi:hypothetical protein
MNALQRIRGVITPLGAGAGGNGKSWSLIFRLNPWRQEKGPLALHDVRVLVPMAEAAAQRAMTRWEKGETVALTARLEKPRRGDTLWHAHARLPIRRVQADAEMVAVLNERAKPRTIDDPVLGPLTLDRAYDWYEGTRTIRGHEYKVTVETPDPDDDRKVARAVAKASAAIRQIERGLAGLREAIAEELLDTYNDSWRDDGDGKRLSRAAFKRRPSLQSVVVASGRTTVYFDDDELFLGHTIEVRLSARGRVSEVCLAG